jgi:hypothetical protein
LRVNSSSFFSDAENRIGAKPSLRTLIVTRPGGSRRARKVPESSVRYVDPPGVINTLAPSTGDPSESRTMPLTEERGESAVGRARACAERLRVLTLRVRLTRSLIAVAAIPDVRKWIWGTP